MNSLPKNILKFFWGDNLAQLNWEKHKNYIAKTILDKGDKEAVEWLLRRVDRKYLKALAKEKGLNAKSKNFWNVYLS